MQKHLFQNPLLSKTVDVVTEAGEKVTMKTDESELRASNGCIRCVGFVGMNGSLLTTNEAERSKTEKVAPEITSKAVAAGKVYLAKGNVAKDPEVIIVYSGF